MRALRIHHLALILMPLAIVLAFAWAPAAETFGESGRIIYFHVPVAWIAALAFSVSGICAILYLRTPLRAGMESRFHNSAVIGMACAVLATVSGSMWARLMWGSYWNWDPRETSIAGLLLVYGAYFSLRAALEHNPSRGRISAAYLVIAMTAMPFFVFVMPRMADSLHPADTLINTGMKMKLDEEMRVTLLCALAAFTTLYLYALSLLQRISRIDARIEERDHE
ncbi:MAG: cytochrome C biogenesis protein [Spirochaetes bacterium]|nr:MAG: cytochrome C biogenesis protein [Spirochaetota bacterium]